VKVKAPTQRKAGQSEFVRWFGPLLQALRDLGGSAAPREALDRIAVIEKVPEELRNAVLKSGQERFYNQVHWARQYLVWEGLLSAGERGIWSLTPLGHKTHLTDEQARALYLRRIQALAKMRKGRAIPESSSVAEAEDLVEDTAQADDDSELGRFLAVLTSLSASGFERLCLRLLREAGFERLQVTGKSNDGGIDGVGVLQVNDLVNFNVVFQCKKWVNPVPPKEIRDLRGAMSGRADKAIFLTTSTFTSGARGEAIRAGVDPIELVDGEKLLEMFKKYRLGLNPRTVYDVDHDFFEAFR
jgi:restriction system protein